MDGIGEWLGPWWVEALQWGLAIGAFGLGLLRFGAQRLDRAADRKAEIEARLTVQNPGTKLTVKFDPVVTGARHTVKVRVVSGKVRLCLPGDRAVKTDEWNDATYAPPELGRKAVELDMENVVTLKGPQTMLRASVIALFAHGVVEVSIRWHGKTQVRQRADITSFMTPGWNE